MHISVRGAPRRQLRAGAVDAEVENVPHPPRCSAPCTSTTMCGWLPAGRLQRVAQLEPELLSARSCCGTRAPPLRRTTIHYLECSFRSKQFMWLKKVARLVRKSQVAVQRGQCSPLGQRSSLVRDMRHRKRKRRGLLGGP
eukprot:scaffold106375_cov28-Tisochrysis_lutea.AAC.1